MLSDDDGHFDKELKFLYPSKLNIEHSYSNTFLGKCQAENEINYATNRAFCLFWYGEFDGWQRDGIDAVTVTRVTNTLTSICYVITHV